MKLFLKPSILRLKSAKQFNCAIWRTPAGYATYKGVLFLEGPFTSFLPRIIADATVRLTH